MEQEPRTTEDVVLPSKRRRLAKPLYSMRTQLMERENSPFSENNYLEFLQVRCFKRQSHIRCVLLDRVLLWQSFAVTCSPGLTHLGACVLCQARVCGTCSKACVHAGCDCTRQFLMSPRLFSSQVRGAHAHSDWLCACRHRTNDAQQWSRPSLKGLTDGDVLRQLFRLVDWDQWSGFTQGLLSYHLGTAASGCGLMHASCRHTTPSRTYAHPRSQGALSPLEPKKWACSPQVYISKAILACSERDQQQPLKPPFSSCVGRELAAGSVSLQGAGG
jgi:hypothetical protein